jgi:uncharacterized protein with HEPN domain
MQRDHVHLLDMLQRAQWIQEFIHDIDQDTFLKDVMRR